MKTNIDTPTVESFGDEWSRFNQRGLPEEEARRIFHDYFAVFPWQALPARASGFDMGCGTGRWARFVAPRVGHLHCIDPSRALEVARQTLAGHPNVTFHQAGVSDIALPAASQDFGYSLGVLHHLPDTRAGLRACVELLKPGAPFLLYLYYAFDNRSLAFRLTWRVSDGLRRIVSRLPAGPKRLTTDALALALYVPLARAALVAERLGLDVSGLPLSYYRNSSFYTMRTDSRDRFGTPLERRFRREEIVSMMRWAGLDDIHVSENAPFWCAVGTRRASDLAMCGFAGVLGAVQRPTCFRDTVLAMSESLRHRGPDDRGIWCDEEAGYGVGHRRLAILDLSPAGHQPMVSKSGRWVIALNGEIYNHLELRRRLEREGGAADWRGHSDTETLLAAVERLGARKAVEASAGMFAFALWDRPSARCGWRATGWARSRFTTAGRDDTFLFGSELKALRAHPAFEPTVDRGALALLLRHNYVPAPYSIYSGIFKLPAGHADCELRDGAVETRSRSPYWSLADVAERGMPEPFAGATREALDRPGRCWARPWPARC